MKVICHFRTDPNRGLTDPLPEKKFSFVFRLYSGDICDPVDFIGTNWFTPPFPKRVWRTFCPYPILPFIAWRFNKRGGYFGFKLYGADSPAYLNWMKKEDVYEGSQALCLSVRPFADITKEAP